MRGAVKSCEPGTTLGHEGIGEVVAIGAEVTKYKVGDRVLVPCITRCNKCKMCEHKFYGHCLDGGWLLGHTINGMQGTYQKQNDAEGMAGWKGRGRGSICSVMF